MNNHRLYIIDKITICAKHKYSDEDIQTLRDYDFLMIRLFKFCVRANTRCFLKHFY